MRSPGAVSLCRTHHRTADVLAAPPFGSQPRSCRIDLARGIVHVDDFKGCAAHFADHPRNDAPNIDMMTADRRFQSDHVGNVCGNWPMFARHLGRREDLARHDATLTCGGLHNQRAIVLDAQRPPFDPRVILADAHGLPERLDQRRILGRNVSG